MGKRRVEPSGVDHRDDGGVPWLAVVGFGIGIGALVARRGMHTLKASGIKMPNVEMPAMSMPNFSSLRGNTLHGFETPMTRKEAMSILDVKGINPSKDTIREKHRKLLVANHPDKGGSTYIASKINEAKDVLLGKGKSATG